MIDIKMLLPPIEEFLEVTATLLGKGNLLGI